MLLLPLSIFHGLSSSDLSKVPYLLFLRKESCLPHSSRSGQGTRRLMGKFREAWAALERQSITRRLSECEDLSFGLESGTQLFCCRNILWCGWLEIFLSFQSHLFLFARCTHVILHILPVEALLLLSILLLRWAERNELLERSFYNVRGSETSTLSCLNISASQTESKMTSYLLRPIVLTLYLCF